MASNSVDDCELNSDPRNSAQANAGLGCCRLGELPKNLETKYDNFAFVSTRRHLEHLPVNDKRTLLISSSWLLWQEALVEGRHCLHLDSALPKDDPDNWISEIFIRSNDWIYDKGTDVTLFKGVSLGRKFVREVSLVILERQRIRHAAQALVNLFAPKKFIFLDVCTETSVLGSSQRSDLVAQLADELGLDFEDRLDPVISSDPYISIKKHYGLTNQDTASLVDQMLWAARNIFTTLLGASSWVIRSLRGRKPGVLLLCSQLSGKLILNSYRGRLSSATMIYLANWFPNKSDIWFVLKNLLNGVLFASIGRSRLTVKDQVDVQTILQKLKNLDEKNLARNTLDIEIGTYLNNTVLKTGRLNEMAETVAWAERLLDRYQPSVILSDGLQNSLNCSVLEIASIRKIRTGITWHGHYIHDHKFDILGGDPRFQNAVDFFCTWGPGNEHWLDAINATARPVRTGNPIVVRGEHTGAIKIADIKKAMILQYAVPQMDFIWPQAGQYEYFVNTARTLATLGVSEIRLKLHPGPTKISYYERIAKMFGINCEVVIEGPFMKHVDWADVVIGPVHTGAMFEVMGAGKPYMPVLFGPHGVNTKYLNHLKYYQDQESLDIALANFVSEDATEFLDDFISFSEFPDPASRVWHVLEDEGKSYV
jgi:hypothetical protein